MARRRERSAERGRDVRSRSQAGWATLHILDNLPSTGSSRPVRCYGLNRNELAVKVVWIRHLFIPSLQVGADAVGGLTALLLRIKIFQAIELGETM